MKRPSSKRSRYYVQKPIQRSLAIRCVLYCVGCLFTVFLFVTVPLALSSNSVDDSVSLTGLFATTWRNYSGAICASFVLIPIIVLDMVQFSHRFVGPLIRLEKQMKALSDGDTVTPLHFREGDFWHGLSEQFNNLRLQQIQLKHQAVVSQECVSNVLKSEVEAELTRYPI